MFNDAGMLGLRDIAHYTCEHRQDRAYNVATVCCTGGNMKVNANEVDLAAAMTRAAHTQAIFRHYDRCAAERRDSGD